MPDKLSPARCGKMVKVVATHERLCSKCLELAGKPPVDNPLLRHNLEAQAAKEAALMAEQSGTAPVTPAGDTSHNSGDSSPGEAVPPAAVTELSPEDKAAEKAVAMLTPVLQERFKEIAEQIKAAGAAAPSPESIKAMIKNEVKEVLTAIIAQKEAAPAGDGSNGAGGSPAPGGGDLMALAQVLMPLLRPSQPAGGGFGQLKEMAEAAKALSDVFSRPFYEGYAQGAETASRLLTFTAKHGGDIDAAGQTIGASLPRHPNAPASAATPPKP